MPSVSRAQQAAMHAAAAGKSTIGIPKSVGEDFAAADHARGPAKLPFHKTMQAHGFAKGSGKRHPASSYKGTPVDQAAYRKFK